MKSIARKTMKFVSLVLSGWMWGDDVCTKREKERRERVICGLSE